MITVVLKADIKPTEDIEKVKEAVLNICPPAHIEVIHRTSDSVFLQGTAQGQEAIEILAKKFRDQHILEAVRQAFLKTLESGSLIFGIHRQAALMGRFHLCDLSDISAMGPIRVEIRAKNLRDIIDYISPATIKGKPQYRKDLILE